MGNQTWNFDCYILDLALALSKCQCHCNIRFGMILDIVHLNFSELTIALKNGLKFAIYVYEIRHVICF